MYTSTRGRLAVARARRPAGFNARRQVTSVTFRTLQRGDRSAGRSGSRFRAWLMRVAGCESWASASLPLTNDEGRRRMLAIRTTLHRPNGGIHACSAGECPSNLTGLTLPCSGRATQLPKSARRPVCVMATHADAGPGASAFVSPSWLAARLNDQSVKVLDASWFMPAFKRDAIAEFKAERIPGSAFFDIDGIADVSTGLPHMVPSEAAFAAAMDVLGITPETHVVLYDRMGMFSAPRAWFTFRVFGHCKVSVMEGGMPAWKELNLPLETSLVSDDTMAAPAMAARADPPPPAAYLAKLDSSKIRSRDDMLHNVNSKEAIVVDARSAGRFVGTEPEPRAGLKSGHIPGARNIPFPQVLDEGCKFKSVDELKAVFSAAGVNVDGQQPLVGSCGSGLTACVLALAVFKATGNLIAVYDGSWMEWGDPVRCDTNPVSTSKED